MFVFKRDKAHFLEHIHTYTGTSTTENTDSECISSDIFALASHISTSKLGLYHIRKSHTFISSKTLSVSPWSIRLHYIPALIKAGN